MTFLPYLKGVTILIFSLSVGPVAINSNVIFQSRIYLFAKLNDIFPCMDVDN